jgi:hypothetical protein
MKKSNWYYLALSLVFFCNMKAQAPRKFYTKFGGTGIDIGYSVIQTLDNQYAITGSTSSFGQGNTDVYLVKMDSMGVILWQKSLGGFVNDVGKSIVQLSDSSYVITGYSNSFGNGGYDVYTVRTDKDGTILWQKAWGGNDWDFGYDIVKTADGNVVICGTTQSLGNGKKDGFVVKYDIANGNVLWQKTYGGKEDDEFKGMTLDNTTQNVLVTGYTKSRGDVLGDVWVFRVATANGDSVQRYMYGGSKIDYANDIVELTNGNLLLCGSSNSFTTATTTTKRDSYFLCFLPNGNFNWDFHYGSPNEDEEAFRIVRCSRPVYAESVHVGETYQISGNKLDIFTYPSAGPFLAVGGFAGTFGFLEDELAYDIALTKDKGYIQVGYTNSFNAVNSDVFVVKRDSTLNYGANLVGINENSKNNIQFLTYPNPVNDLLTLHLSEQTKLPVNVELISLDGRVLRKYKQYSPQETIDLSNCEAGIYLLKVFSNNFYKTIKLEKR